MSASGIEAMMTDMMVGMDMGLGVGTEMDEPGVVEASPPT